MYELESARQTRVIYNVASAGEVGADVPVIIKASRMFVEHYEFKPCVNLRYAACGGNNCVWKIQMKPFLRLDHVFQGSRLVAID